MDQSDLQTKAIAILKKHPEFWDSIARAHYAYHANHNEPDAHYFAGSSRDSACRWCGQTREGVRHDWYDSSPRCQNRPEWTASSIEAVIVAECRQFSKVLGKAKEVAGTMDLDKATGESLAVLHHTHGIDPTMLEAALLLEDKVLPQRLHDEYLVAYAAHKETGKRGLVREVIIAKTA